MIGDVLLVHVLFVCRVCSSGIGTNSTRFGIVTDIGYLLGLLVYWLLI